MTVLYDVNNIDCSVYKVTSLEELKKSKGYSDGVYSLSIDNTRLDVLHEKDGRENNGIAIVCFTAAISDRAKKTGPFFSGRGLGKIVGLPLLAIADPVISEEPINLAWYAGSEKNTRLQQQISEILDVFASVSGYHTLILVGGSGAGFASLAQLTLDTKVSLKAVVWNPQTSIERYNPRFVREYIAAAFKKKLSQIGVGGGYKKIFDALNIQSEVVANDILTKNKYLYLQNFSDHTHYKDHLLPFVHKSHLKWDRIGEGSFISVEENGGIYVADWGKGHVSPPYDLLVKLVRDFAYSNDIRSILNDVEDRYVNLDLKEISVSLFENDSWSFNIVKDKGRLKIKIFFKEGYKPTCEYAFYLLKNGKRVDFLFYQNLSYHEFDISNYGDNADLSVTAFIRFTSGEKLIKTIKVTD